MAVGLALVAAQLAYRGWALAGSWFYFDDLAFMSRAMNQPFGAGYLTESYGGHLMPAGFAVTWALTKWAVFDWAPWAVGLLAMQAVAGVGMLRLLISLFGSRPTGAGAAGRLPGLRVHAARPACGGRPASTSCRSRSPWSSGCTPTWPTCAPAACGTWSPRSAGPSAASLFYEKTLLLFGVYAIVALCYFTAGDTTDAAAGPVGPVPPRGGGAHGRRRDVPRALRGVRPELLPRRQQQPAVDPDRLGPGRRRAAARR